MPNILPSKAASHYLDAIGAAAIYIALPRIGAASVRGLRRLPRDVGDIQWIVWVRDLASARTVADPELVWNQDNGVKRCRPLPELVAAIEQRAHDLSVPLTPHEKAVERSKALAQRVDETLNGLRCSGALAAFNRSYKLHRQQSDCAQPYSFVFDQLRSEVIRFLVNTPRDKASPALLHAQLRAQFGWYVYYG